MILDLAREAELTNPLAEELWAIHGEQVEELDEMLSGVGYLEEPKGMIYQCKENRPRRRPATDKEASTATMEWTMRLTADLTGDIPAQLAGKLKKLARRLLRTAKRIENAQAAGELSGPIQRVFHVRNKSGEILATFKTRTAAILHSARIGDCFVDVDVQEF